MPETRRDLDLENLDDLRLRDFISYRLLKVSAKVAAQGARRAKQVSGLSLAQWRVLALVGSKENFSASDLIQDDLMDKGIFSRNSKQLVEEGLLTQELNPKDHRSKSLCLTPKGKEVYEKTLPRMKERQKAMLSCLTLEERQALYSALDKIEKFTESH